MFPLHLSDFIGPSLHPSNHSPFVFYSSHRALSAVSQMFKQKLTTQPLHCSLCLEQSSPDTSIAILHIFLRGHFPNELYNRSVEKGSPPPLTHHSFSFPIIPSHAALVFFPTVFTIYQVLACSAFYFLLSIPFSEYKLHERKVLFYFGS